MLQFHRKVACFSINDSKWRHTQWCFKCCSVCPECILNLFRPVLPGVVDCFLHNGLDFSIRYFCLPICLWVVCDGCTMSYSILVQDFVNHLIAEMSIVICNQCSGSAEPSEYVVAKKLGHYPSIISAGWYCFNRLRDVIYCHQDVHVIKRRGKWTHEIHPP